MTVLDVGDVEATGMLLNVLENTDSADVVTSSDQNLGSIFELDQALDLSSLKVQLQFKRDIKYKYFRIGKDYLP